MGVLKEGGRAYSVCPVCLKRIPARREEKNGEIFLVKTCPEHGFFSTVIWRNKVDFSGWRGERPEVLEHENLNCPTGCGLCPDHMRGTCCTLLEITKRCNMDCAYCFADPDGEQGKHAEPQKNGEPDMSAIRHFIDDLTEPGKTLLQLSGGEPTIRDDLPEIVAYAKRAGCKYVQLNSNGLRLAKEESFVKQLAEAGLSFVFMQFDGVEDSIYRKLRRRPMFDIKKQAIENCGKYGIGVTLVPVIVPDLNVDQIGDIIRFAVERSPYVRGVHFQPVSYFGRIPEIPEERDRFTLDQLMDEVVKQSGGLVELSNLAPSCCDHPMCGFHSDFIVMPDRSLMPLTKDTRADDKAGGCCCCADPADKNREFVGRRWERRDDVKLSPKEEGGCCCGTATKSSCDCGFHEEELDMTSMEQFLSRAKSHGFTITSMAFQDAGNLDIERLRQCSLHVYKDGKRIPFCAYYLSPMGKRK